MSRRGADDVIASMQRIIFQRNWARQGAYARERVCTYSTLLMVIQIIRYVYRPWRKNTVGVHSRGNFMLIIW